MLKTCQPIFLYIAKFIFLFIELNLDLFLHNANFACMDITPQKIKDWLKTSGHSREWLAEKLLVSKATIDGWLAPSRPIPSTKLAFIKKLMLPQKNTLPPIKHDDVIAFTVRFTPEEWAAMLPPEIDPNDQAAAEKYVRKKLQEVIDETPELDINELNSLGL